MLATTPAPLLTYIIYHHAYINNSIIILECLLGEIPLLALNCSYCMPKCTSACSIKMIIFKSNVNITIIVLYINSDCLPLRDVKVKDTGLQLQKQWDWICQDTAITDAAKSIQFYCLSPSKPTGSTWER